MFSQFVLSQVKHNSYFLLGLALGLWVSLAVVPLEDDIEPCIGGSAAPPSDEFEPQREEKPLGSGGQPGGRSVQRPRYYSTELGMRGSLLAGALSSEAALGTRVAALNRTAARLQPALRFFITASALQAAPGLANVVGFTDTREMLKPFHALKYLADNYLEEYDFFFLVSDTSYVNARRLTELVSQLSVSQDIYMGTVAEDDSHYCTLEGGILLSNSVLRSVHAELDWCVRNSYSPHHHENVGRCVLHSAHLACMPQAQGEQYVSVRVDAAGVGGALSPALADAVTVHALPDSEHFYQLHAYLSRVYLEQDSVSTRLARSALRRGARRHPPGYRNSSWPGGLRADPGLAPPPPDTRFDHLRWTAFNATHANMPDDHRVQAPLSDAHRQALDLVMETVKAWASVRWGVAVELVEGWWCWEPATALRYRLIVREGGGTLRGVEVARALGAARLVPVPYVTESARVSLVLPLRRTDPAAPHDVAAFLQRYEALALNKDRNTALYLVLMGSGEEQDAAEIERVRATVRDLAGKYRGATVEAIDSTTCGDAADEDTRCALHTALPRTPRDALLLIVAPHLEFNEDFLNRVRMNTVMGRQWYLPIPFARFAQWQHPRFRDANGNRPTTNTGRFNPHHRLVLSFYRPDYESAMSDRGGEEADPATVLAGARGLQCVRAPEPGAVLAPRAAPCVTDDASCLRDLRDQQFSHLDLGARSTLAKLLLELQAEQAG